MLLAAVGGPSVAVTGWLAWLLLCGAACTAILAVVGVWRKVLHPMLKVGAVIEESFPVWVSIAERYGQGGQETISLELRALAANDEISAANQKAMLARLDAVIAKSDLLDSKLSETRHKIIGDLSALRAGSAGAMTLVEQMERTSQDLQDVRRQLAEIAPKKPE